MATKIVENSFQKKRYIEDFLWLTKDVDNPTAQSKQNIGLVLLDGGFTNEMGERVDCEFSFSVKDKYGEEIFPDYSAKYLLKGCLERVITAARNEVNKARDNITKMEKKRIEKLEENALVNKVFVESEISRLEARKEFLHNEIKELEQRHTELSGKVSKAEARLNQLDSAYEEKLSGLLNEKPTPAPAPIINMSKQVDMAKFNQIDNERRELIAENTGLKRNYVTLLGVKDDFLKLKREYAVAESKVHLYEVIGKLLAPELKKSLFNKKFSGKTIHIADSQIDKVFRLVIKHGKVVQTDNGEEIEFKDETVYSIAKTTGVNKSVVRKLLMGDYAGEYSLDKILRVLKQIKGNWNSEHNRVLNLLIGNYEKKYQRVLSESTAKKEKFDKENADIIGIAQTFYDMKKDKESLPDIYIALEKYETAKEDYEKYVRANSAGTVSESDDGDEVLEVL